MIEYLKWMTYAVMPLVYDESLSYVELLNKVVAKLNEVIKETNYLSEHIDAVLTEWLKTDEAQKAVEDAVGQFIEAYSKTPSFHDVLVEALATQSTEIKNAATQAAQDWLNSTEGNNAVNADVVKYLDEYVKTDAFQLMVQDYVNSLDTIRRGDTLAIKQKNFFRVYSPDSEIQAAYVDDNYNTVLGDPIVSVTRERALFGSKGAGLRALANGDMVMDKTLYMGALGTGIRNKIKFLGDPVDIYDAVTKQYVDTRVADGSGVTVVTLTKDDIGQFVATKTYDEIRSLWGRVLLVDNTAPNYDVYYPMYDNGDIMFMNIVSITSGNNRRTTYKRYKLTSDNAWSQFYSYDDSADHVLVNGRNPFTGNQSMGNNRLMGVRAPVDGGDATNKEYVDSHSIYTIYGEYSTSDDDYKPVMMTGISYGEISTAIERHGAVELKLSESGTDKDFIVMHLSSSYYSPSYASYTFMGIFLDEYYKYAGNRYAIMCLEVRSTDATNATRYFKTVYDSRFNTQEALLKCTIGGQDSDEITAIEFNETGGITIAAFELLLSENSNVELWLSQSGGTHVYKGVCIQWEAGANANVVFEVKNYSAAAGTVKTTYWLYIWTSHTFTKLT